MWKNFVEEPHESYDLEFEMIGLTAPKSIEDMQAIVYPNPKHNHASICKAVEYMNLFLQTQSQLERGIADIYEQANKENVICTLPNVTMSNS